MPSLTVFQIGIACLYFENQFVFLRVFTYLKFYFILASKISILQIVAIAYMT